MFTLLPHIRMSPNQERTRTGTHRKGRGYKKQHIHVRGLKNNNTFPYNFIIRSQSQTIKELHFIVRRHFGDEVKKESNYLLWPLVPHRKLKRHTEMWAFEGASKVIWEEQTRSGMRIITRFTKLRQSQNWMPGLSYSQTYVLSPSCTAQPKGDRAGTFLLLPLYTMEQCCGVKRKPISISDELQWVSALPPMCYVMRVHYWLIWMISAL